MMLILPQVKELQRADLQDINGTGNTMLSSGNYRNITGTFADINSDNTKVYCLNFNATITSINASSNPSYTATTLYSDTLDYLINKNTSERTFSMTKGNKGGNAGGGGGGGGQGGGKGGTGGRSEGNPGRGGANGDVGIKGNDASGTTGGAGGAGGNGGAGGKGGNGYPNSVLPRGYPQGGAGGAGGDSTSGAKGGRGESGGTDFGGNCPFGWCSYTEPGGDGGGGGGFGGGAGGTGGRGGLDGGVGAGSYAGGGGGGGGGKGYSGSTGSTGEQGREGTNPSKSLYLVIHNSINGSISVNSNYNKHSYYIYRINHESGGTSGQQGLGSNGHTSKINILSRNYINETITSESIAENNSFSYELSIYGETTYRIYYYSYVYTKVSKTYNYSNSRNVILSYSNQTNGLAGMIGGDGKGGSAGVVNGGRGGAGSPGVTGSIGVALSNTPEKKIYPY